MSVDGEPVSSAGADRAASRRDWALRPPRSVIAGILLVYLLYVGGAVGEDARGTGQVCGYVILATFAVSWIVAMLPIGQVTPRRFWILYGALLALFAAELPFAHASAFVMCVFITMITVIRIGARAAPIVLALALAALLVPVAIRSWHDSIGTALGDVTPVAIPVVALATFATAQVVRSNQALTEARAQLARLAAENERFRIARDLHDLLGHSLTTITVKAGLAARLGAADPARAVLEIAEVEALARQALGDVRAAVTGFRDVTLAGELTAGRELLQAAGIVAELPGAVDAVDPAHQELFGWVVREGLTNIVRHAHASWCAVRLSRSAVEIEDDGVGGTAAAGNGLSGLRERVAAAGGVVDAGPLETGGWRLRVSLPLTGGTR